ncbi:hypothetical protein [Halobaculum limi]|uniref:hypothetical protein n=1 Tax=Halobaculum limi TaxID=3031916 RepID=UPI002404BA97|nr:hypothetical protein [Halobaculum sp. YSMS11]
MVPLPLFGALPGGVELLVIFFIFLILSLLIPVGMAYWVYRDAQSRGNDDATIWALATVLAGLFVSVFGAGAVLLLYILIGRE